MPNVNLAYEMVDLITATRAYEANLSVAKNGREMADRTLASVSDFAMSPVSASVPPSPASPHASLRRTAPHRSSPTLARSEPRPGSHRRRICQGFRTNSSNGGIQASTGRCPSPATCWLAIKDSSIKASSRMPGGLRCIFPDGPGAQQDGRFLPGNHAHARLMPFCPRPSLLTPMKAFANRCFPFGNNSDSTSAVSLGLAAAVVVVGFVALVLWSRRRITSCFTDGWGEKDAAPSSASWRHKTFPTRSPPRRRGVCAL